MNRMDLSSIATNYATKPPRIVVYGDHGIGKTTFATSAPAPVVIRTEDGLAAIQVPTFPIATSFADVIDALATLYMETHPFQTVVIDTLDWLEPLVWAHTAQLGSKENIEDFGYGKGYKNADVHWRTIFDGLNALNAKGMTIICLAHHQVKRFAAPDTEAYDRYQLKLHDRAIGFVSEWADVIAFAHHEVFTVSQDAGAGKKIVRGTGGLRRILSVEERPAYDAKNRHSLPADLDFPRDGAWNVFADACAPAFSQPTPAPLNLVPTFATAPSAADGAMNATVDRLFGEELDELQELAAQRGGASNDDTQTDLVEDIRRGDVVDVPDEPHSLAAVAG
jgi:hypothetical protein